MRPSKPLVIRIVDTGSGTHPVWSGFSRRPVDTSPEDTPPPEADGPSGRDGVAGAAAVDGVVFPLSAKEVEASIIVGSSADGAASVAAPAGFETGSGKVDASEIPAPSTPAESTNTSRLTVLLLPNAISFMSSCKTLRNCSVRHIKR
jgi:hypothetical protein